MFHDKTINADPSYELEQMGTNAIAYMREISIGEVIENFPDASDIPANTICWAMFAADGTPLMLANAQEELVNSAFYNDLNAVLPN